MMLFFHIIILQAKNTRRDERELGKTSASTTLLMPH
ncbi:hypothetical protein H4V97_001404 [Flavobacterium sp. CG_23.5]|nr:hypothetical protein [Flavobacterium sp. CG_23.5]